MEKDYYVYILTNYNQSTFYTGVTSDLIKRAYEHQNKVVEGFSAKYNLDIVVYYEIHGDIENAIKREKQIKRYSKISKINLIKKENPEFKDLSQNW